MTANSQGTASSEYRRTAQRYIDLMRDVFGKAPTSRHRFAEDFNDAGREIFTAAEGAPWYHSWSWAVREHVNLPIVAGLEYVRLPDDFGQLIHVEEDQRRNGGVQVVAVGKLLSLRSSTTISHLTIWLAFDVGRPQGSPDLPPGKYAAIYPVQDADRSDVYMSYRSVWADHPIAADGTLADPMRVPNIPKEWERALMLLCQAKAIETGDRMAPQETLAAYGAELTRLVALDSGRQPNKGRPLHSVRNRAASGGRGFDYPHRGIARP